MAKGGLFGKKKQQPAVPDVGVMKEMTGVSARLRVLESRHTELNRKIELIESNTLSDRKRFVKEMKLVDSDIVELRKEIEGLKENILRIISELKLAASKEDIDTLKKYLDLWQPVKFVTREEVEEIIEEKLSK